MDSPFSLRSDRRSYESAPSFSLNLRLPGSGPDPRSGAPPPAVYRFKVSYILIFLSFLDHLFGKLYPKAYPAHLSTPFSLFSPNAPAASRLLSSHPAPQYPSLIVNCPLGVLNSKRLLTAPRKNILTSGFKNQIM